MRALIFFVQWCNTMQRVYNEWRTYTEGKALASVKLISTRSPLVCKLFSPRGNVHLIFNSCHFHFRDSISNKTPVILAERKNASIHR